MGFCLGTPISMSSAFTMIFFLGSGGVDVIFPFSSTYAIIFLRSPLLEFSFLSFFLSSFSFLAFCFCFSLSFLFHVSCDLPIVHFFVFNVFNSRRYANFRLARQTQADPCFGRRRKESKSPNHPDENKEPIGVLVVERQEGIGLRLPKVPKFF